MDGLVTGSATVLYHGVYIDRSIYGFPYAVIPPDKVCSNLFAAGNLYWSARFVCRNKTYGGGDPCLSMFLELWSRCVKVKAFWELSVVDPRSTRRPITLYATPPLYFVSTEGDAPTVFHWDLDCDDRVKDLCYRNVDLALGRLVLQIAVTVVPDDADPATTTQMIDDDVPPSDMLDQLGQVLETREGADVVFAVDGELFPAHKIVLAMRSRVFKAQLYGEMKESGARPVVIREITADAFRALLRYIYTDDCSFSPASSSSNQQQQDEGEGGRDNDKVWDLLAAADRFSVERLKLICERILCKRLDVNNVAEMLGLADRHHCGKLKDVCIKFMTTSHRMGQVKKSQGFLKLKHYHPHLLVEVLEKF